jgi:4-aminobutyrate aminotransferase-like enzyme
MSTIPAASARVICTNAESELLQSDNQTMSSVETKTTQSETVRKHKEFIFPAVATYYDEPLALVRGDGFHVWDDQGNKYLDCFGGVLTVSVGHANPKVNEAIINQARSITKHQSPWDHKQFR